jgi:hypothetical protein
MKTLVIRTGALASKGGFKNDIRSLAFGIAMESKSKYFGLA